MKKLKGTLLFILTLSLCLSFLPLNLVNAEEFMEDFDDKVAVINEYEALKKLNEELSESNNTRFYLNEEYSEETLYIIENYDKVYREKIENLKNEDIDTLIYLGYEQDQIDAIQNFDGSEEMLMRASSRLTLRTGIRMYTYDERYNETTARLNIDFRWSGGPASTMYDDILAFTWSDDYIVDTRRSYIEVEYRNEEYREYETETYDIEYRGLNKANFIIPKHVSRRNSSSPGGVRGYTITDGGGTIYFSDRGRIPRIRVFGAYGYNTWRLNPSFSVDGSGSFGLGIDFDSGITELDYDFQYEYLD